MNLKDNILQHILFQIVTLWTIIIIIHNDFFFMKEIAQNEKENIYSKYVFTNSATRLRIDPNILTECSF